ncbi:replication protein RepA4 [Salmonella enterica subsp. enterica serovar Newport]|nr:replication protein RepA4 [Salmonella enterica subsp. enterica serovar Newport]EDM0874538.1 replication protein RepA4 [Salmonella enterica]EEN6708702.1 replication protein RepA4 [Salmonella enterica subsp. enterica serovar Rubislaw]
MSLELMCAFGVVTARVFPQPGRISALADRRAAYGRVTQNFQPELLTATQKFSYIIQH